MKHKRNSEVGMGITVKRIDGKLIAEIPVDIAEALGIEEGDHVDLSKIDLNEDMRLVEQIMVEDDDVLRRLAQ